MKRLRLIAAMLLASVGIFLVVSWLARPKVVYSMGVADFLALGPSDRPVRVEGALVPRTLCRMDTECGYRFRLADSRYFYDDGASTSEQRNQLSVRYDACVVPDTFRDFPGLDLTVVVEGNRCQNCHDFEATRILAKCPGKYEIRDAAAHYGTSAPLPRCSALVPTM
jgi:cytochrome c-type biogenesis protein CcmE